MSGEPDPNLKAPLEVGVAAEKQPEKAASDNAVKDDVKGALTIEQPAGVDAAIEPDGKEESEDNTKKKEGKAETVAQKEPLKTPFDPEVSFDLRKAFANLFEGLDRALTSAYRRGTVLGKIAAAPEGIFYAIYDLLKKKIPKPDSKGAASAAEGEMLNIGPSLSVASNTGGASAQLQNMAQRLDNEIAPQFTALQETSYGEPAVATQSVPAASTPTEFKLRGKSAGSIVAAAPADSGSVAPGAAVPIKKAAASTVKKR